MYNQPIYLCTINLYIYVQSTDISMYNQPIYLCTINLYIYVQSTDISMYNQPIYLCTIYWYIYVQLTYISMHSFRLSSISEVKVMFCLESEIYQYQQSLLFSDQ